MATTEYRRYSDQVIEENVIILAGRESVPASIWAPENGAIRSVVLLGHGLGVDRQHEYNTRTARLLTAAGIVVVAPEIPLHGERSSGGAQDWRDVVSAWQEFWATGGVQSLLDEWICFQNYAAQRFPGKPIGYFGLSLATQYGIPLLANNQLIKAAVLGLFGSHPPPKTRVMNHYAPGVSCPIAFLKQLGDELHPSSTADHLYDSLGSTEKQMFAAEGRHAEVPEESLQAAIDYFTQQLDTG